MKSFVTIGSIDKDVAERGTDNNRKFLKPLVEVKLNWFICFTSDVIFEYIKVYLYLTRRVIL